MFWSIQQLKSVLIKYRFENKIQDLRDVSRRRNLFNLMVCSTNIMKEKMLVTMSQYINIAPIRRPDLVFRFNRQRGRLPLN